MNKHISNAQFLLRLALGIGFILPVLDRIGALGAPGSSGVGWGNWSNFVDYTHSLMPYIDRSLANIAGLIATIAEVVFGILLIIGYKTKWAAFGSFGLTLIFALSMFFFANYRAPFNYSVFVVSFSSLLLAGLPYHKWSLD
ncbi:DoxX family membrane protein [Chitinophaga sp. SYP-B3965]|uniref:DoxX family protein n=1 Tax=Chitinophaga sp. SYP-B3965 TaxID=2663120 RepID=UPI001299CF62|nr:DoxX family protein [Chitinophaga sp. SYP-B3965]MRG47299.1 DoxX family membrane protein [Chitinophaga sp. SYP-B3965]